MKRKILAMAAALLLAPMTAGLAQAAGGGYMGGYLIGKVGAYLPDESNVNTGFNGEIGFGFNLVPKPGLLAIEGTTGYFNASQSSYYMGGGYQNYMKFQADVVPLAVSLKAGIEARPFTFYVGGGFDLLFASMEAKYRSLYYGRYSDSDNDTVLGGHVMAGVTIDINPQMFIGAEVKYLATQDVSMSLYGYELTGDLNGVTVSGMLGIRF